MSGILDSKTRVLDTIVTLEGRQQLAAGGINIHYVTYSDGATYYAADVVSGSADATVRLYLETCNLPQDQVTFKSDAQGHVSPFNSASDKVMSNGRVIDYSFPATSVLFVTGSQLSGEEFLSYADGILTGSIDNFVKQRLIATRDPIFDDDGFSLGNNEIQFNINDDKPLPASVPFTENIDHLEDIFADTRCSRSPNFKYLPPINRLDHTNLDKTNHGVVSEYALGIYPPWGRSPVTPINQDSVWRSSMNDYGNIGYVKTVNFEPTSRNNQLFMQAFEVTTDMMFKLDVIDFGTWYSSTISDVGPMCQVFFVGKLLTKPRTGTSTFVHLFTLFFG
jgi:hypothetical protein